jgi:polyisoprenyl-phosphate glycosyltransferase
VTQLFPKSDVSIVVPVYGCAANLQELFWRTMVEMKKYLGETARIEWIFVDDFSRDDAWDVIMKLRSTGAGIHGIRLGKNHGQHAAIMTGLLAAKSEWTVVMDCDLEDPPEEIPSLLKTAKPGNDIIVGTYLQRKHSYWRRICSRFFRWLLDLPIKDGFQLSTFSVLSKRARMLYLNSPMAGRFYLLILLQLNLSLVTVESRKEKRLHGSSSYTIKKLLCAAVRCLLLYGTKRILVMIVLLTIVILNIGIMILPMKPMMLLFLMFSLFCVFGYTRTVNRLNRRLNLVIDEEWYDNMDYKK